MKQCHTLAIVWIGGFAIALGATRLYAQVRFLPSVVETLPTVSNAAQPHDGQLASSTTNPVLWQQYQVLQTPAETVPCERCSPNHYDRCGNRNEVFPWARGPGNCDQWHVGPHWAVEADGLILFRDDADWNRVITAVGLAPTVVEQFDAGPGGRIFVTGYNESGFGIQVGYEGVNDWNATAVFPLASATRTFDYETRMNSVEINFLPLVPYVWKFFSGFRYVEIDEDFIDFTVNDKTIPAPADPPAASVPYVDTGTSFLLENRLIGFQVGGRRDTWQWNEWITFESFFNTGVYYNKFRRDDITRTVTTIITGDDLSTPDVDEFSQTTNAVNAPVVRRNFSDIAFLGEAGITGVVRLNPCVALRGGYQVMVVDGVSEGLDAFFAPGLNTSTLVYHGLQFGLEYRR